MPDAASAPQPNRWYWSRAAVAPLFVVLLSAGGCLFSPRPPAGKITCSHDRECPADLPVCYAGLCTVGNHDAVDDAPNTPVDPAADAGIDGAVEVRIDAASDGALDAPANIDAAGDGALDAAADVSKDTAGGDANPDDGSCPTTPPCQLPLTVVLSPGTSTPIRGNTGTEIAVYQDACPNGSAVIGLHVVTNSSQNQGIEVVAQLQTVCGSLKVSADRTAVQVTLGNPLFWRGAVAGPVGDLLCPQDQVVMGFEGHSFQLLDQLAVRCVPLTVTGTTVSSGTPTTLPPAGGTGGSTFSRTDCPAGQVAGGTNIGVSNLISAFGLICVTVGVH